MTVYRVEVTREDKWWMVAIPALDGLTQARRLEVAPLMAREYIAVTLDLDIDEVQVEVALIDVDGADVSQAIARLDAAKLDAETARERVVDETRRLAEALAAKKVPVRDIGEILGVSHQRAHQLLS